MAQMCWQSHACSDYLSKFSELSQLEFPTCQNSTDSDCAVCEKIFHTFIYSSHWWMSPEFGTLNRGQITSKLGKPPRNLCSSQLVPG